MLTTRLLTSNRCEAPDDDGADSDLISSSHCEGIRAWGSLGGTDYPWSGRGGHEDVRRINATPDGETKYHVLHQRGK